MPEVQTVKVMVRVRPFNEREKSTKNEVAVTLDTQAKQVLISKPKEKEQPKAFTFDYVFGQESTQQYIYEQSSFSLVNNVIEGYNGTIFAYGQTGCGKTFTMMGNPQKEELMGIIPRTFRQIVAVTGADTQKKYLVRCSFIEIYNEEIHDMLSGDNKAKRQLRQHPSKGVYVQDLVINTVKSTQQMQKWMDIGFKNRATRETAMNKQSSRSHSVFTIFIQSSQVDEKGNQRYKVAKLNLVDLAGSQKQKRTNAVGDGLRQATKINLSLSALGNVISALVDGKDGKHIPYRDSKLTRILQDSLGGNTKTIMIANISPSGDSYDESLSTLRYASRAKFIKNKPIVNQDPKDAMLRQYAQQIKHLKQMLEGKIPIDSKIVTHGKANKQNSIQLQQQLRKKQILLTNQKQQRAKILKQLEQLQQITSTQPQDASSKVQMQKIKKLNQKLQEQRRKQQKYLLQKKKRQNALNNIEIDYKNLHQQVDSMKQRFKQVKKKYVSNLTQLRDLQMQHQNTKEDLLETIRYQQSEVKKYTEIIMMLMSTQDLQKINNASEWNEEMMEHKIPYFYLRDKVVTFTKSNNPKEFIENQKSKKQLVFRKNSIQYKRQSEKEEVRQLRKFVQKQKKDEFQVSNIIRGARQQCYQKISSKSSWQKPDKAVMVRLNPLN